MAAKPLSQRRTQPSKGCMVVFFGLFLAVGCAASYFMLLRPALGLLAARSWVEAQCLVQASRVEESSDSDGSTYKPVIEYTYTFGGDEYRSSRYQFLEVSSSGYEGKAEIVARYQPGTRVVCYVNPDNPAEAVLVRDLSWVYLLGLLPLIFVAVGAGGIVHALRGGFQGGQAVARSKAEARGQVLTPFGITLPAGSATGGPVPLRPGISPMGKLVGLTFLALFWNGITGVFVYQAVNAWRYGEPDGCLTAFLVPFVLVGLALIYGACRQVLVLFAPRPHLTLSRGYLIPGEAGLLQWRFTGSASKIQRLRIVLEGREEARYRRGTDTYTAKEVFLTLPVVEATHASMIAAGTARVPVPEATMPSFEASHNKIVWALKVTCEVPNWPDDEDEYPVLVLPAVPSVMSGRLR